MTSEDFQGFITRQGASRQKTALRKSAQGMFQVPVFFVSIEAVAAGVDVVGAVEGVMEGEGVLRPGSSTLVAVIVAYTHVGHA